MNSAFKIVCSLMVVGVMGCHRVPEIGGNPEEPDSDLIKGTDMPVLDELQGADYLPEQDKAEYEWIQDAFAQSRKMSAEDVATQFPVGHFAELSFDPTMAVNIDLIQQSPMALSEEAFNIYEANGFVVDNTKGFSSFFNGYKEIYQDDLPVYVSADAILDSIHRSYTDILAQVEYTALRDELDAMLSGMRSRLANLLVDENVRRDLDLYLSVAASLLAGEVQTPVAGADSTMVQNLFGLATAGGGSGSVDLFGESRQLDFSQFVPRGHYDSWELRDYFRAMMWLGRIDFRLVETLSDGTQQLNRSQVAATLAMNDLIGADMDRWTKVDEILEFFVGKSDSMVLDEVPQLQASIDEAGGLDKLSDDQVKEIVLKGGFGTQQISSHVMVNGLQSGTLPLNSSFLFFGQRYVIDSHVFSNLVYDRVMGGTVMRMMPNPLDVGFAALGNNQALSLLDDELARYEYAPDLYMMRALVDEKKESFWSDSLYNGWLNSLRSLSDVAAGKLDDSLPAPLNTEAFGRRLLNAQMGSWAELRHDTLLYAKQSYSAIPGCTFPDAYVEPVPSFFKAVSAYADKGLAMTALVDDGWASRRGDYFTNLAYAADILGEMAQNQLDRVPHSPSQLQFINQAVSIEYEDVICAQVEHPAGWYAKLFYEGDTAFRRDPTIADVHTQSADEAGNDVGRILHVGTGLPRLMVVAVDQCDGPRAYAGVVFSYHEQVTDNWKRMTDQEWNQSLYDNPPADVPWMTDLVSR